MEGLQNEQTQRSSAKESQKCLTEYQSEALGGSQTDSGVDGHDTKRLDRGYSRGRDSEHPICFLVGGILKQSRAQMEERLQEYEDCLKWYKDGKEKVLKQIEELKRLEQDLEDMFSRLEEKE